jgi:hypothetical protein
MGRIASRHRPQEYRIGYERSSAEIPEGYPVKPCALRV